MMVWRIIAADYRSGPRASRPHAAETAAVPKERPRPTAVPAKAGTHRSTSETAEAWIPAFAGTAVLGSRVQGRKEPAATPSPPPGAERAGVRWGVPERFNADRGRPGRMRARRPRLPTPTSPSHAFGAGPSLSPPKGREGGIEPAPL